MCSPDIPGMKEKKLLFKKICPCTWKWMNTNKLGKKNVFIIQKLLVWDGRADMWLSHCYMMYTVSQMMLMKMYMTVSQIAVLYSNHYFIFTVYFEDVFWLTNSHKLWAFKHFCWMETDCRRFQMVAMTMCRWCLELVLWNLVICVSDTHYFIIFITKHEKGAHLGVPPYNMGCLEAH